LFGAKIGSFGGIFAMKKTIALFAAVLMLLCAVPFAAIGEMNLAAAKTVIEKGLSVRRAEALAAQLLKDTQERPAKKAAGVDYLGECARHLEQVLGRKVRMTQGRKTGRIELEYYDADDREALLQALEAIGRRN
jgi:ParB-like chromosome segregation protein Spo0J